MTINIPLTDSCRLISNVFIGSLVLSHLFASISVSLSEVLIDPLCEIVTNTRALVDRILNLNKKAKSLKGLFAFFSVFK